ncbi:MAG TPA: helix-turn-helix transcriptional regulator [Syntrophorhabdaceae bacterium]|jgi:transcriptional regulator with XRE-family HTH domain|nr:helix-turn-helix transcriptional regulator [Syntrophorhabdaceae bacterium]HOS04869.1 helix-turn-helix transcriptional regulator [Syntrophorhabdaceae bacterium]HPL40164.1 helix-turn-helix transcriptional regulator [Syntrophorhabdaceae bacterium]
MDTETLMKRLGLRLKALRLRNHLKQEDLENYGFSYRYYGKIERGVVNPTLDTLLRLCRIFKVNLSDLFVFIDAGELVDEEREAISLKIADLLREENREKEYKLKLFLDEFL